MSYSLASMVALFVTIVINFDILFGKNYRGEGRKAFIPYRILIWSAAAFFLFDLLWGLLDPIEPKIFATIDTALYFASMSFFLFAWANFVAHQLTNRKWIRLIITLIGVAFCLTGIVLVIVNFFVPTLFSYDTDAYVPSSARKFYLAVQITIFAISALYSFVLAVLKRKTKGLQFAAIGLSGLVMAGLLTAQYFDPHTPFYPMGCFALLTIVHVFVALSEKEGYKSAVEEGLKREAAQAAELSHVQEIAYTDSLTGAKSKHSYVEFEAEIDRRIREKEIEEFALFIFDLNNLKHINDEYGHAVGDKYIIKSCDIIRKFLPDVDLYRYGGDEFVAFIEGEKYKERFKILESFNAYIDQNIGTNEPIIAAGFSVFIPEHDNTLSVVFARADEKMYRRKKALKGLSGQGFSDKRMGESVTTNPRLLLYETFYYSDKFSLIDMLNNSNYDEIIEVDLNDDTYRLLYHTEGKYVLPEIEGSYRELIEFDYKHNVHPEDYGAYMNLLRPENFFERLRNADIPNFDFAHFRYKLQGGEYRYIEQCVIAGKENGIPEGKIRMYVFDINNMKTRQLGNIADDSALISLGRDQMTGLLTNRDFLKAAEKLIEERSGVNWALVAIDIEHFKFFSEWFGRKKGDILLGTLGKALGEFEGEVDGLAGYFGQDDFVMLMPQSRADVEKLYEKTKAVVHSFDLTGGLLLAFGVAQIEDELSVADAFDRASIATAKAKLDIATRICYYTRDMQFSTELEYRILTNFANALQQGEITFYLQPQCRISTGAIVGAEALVRWIRKDGSMVYPSDFVPILEKYGFITDLDKYLWDKVASWISQRITDGKEIVPISINVSRVDIFNLDLAEHFHSLCEKYNLPHKYLKIEITESSYAETTDRIDELVTKLHDDGFVVMMDDFGSGYSSLNMLSNLELDAIKMDAKFLDIHGADYEKGVRILESVVNMAKMMALPIVVEGVETKEETEFLSGLGCRYAQGYYFYKPISVADFEKEISDKKKVDHRGFVAKANEQFRIREFLDKNVYSDSMLNNILGPVAIYSLKGEHVDIIRYNEQFYQAVNVPDFMDRLVAIDQFVPEEDRPALFNALAKAKENKLLGYTAAVRFGRIDGTLAYFEIHFYYLGKKEGADQFYGSAHNMTSLLNVTEEKKLISQYSTDNIIFVTKVYDKWRYEVSSNAIAELFGCDASKVEEELNNGEFAKRIVSPRGLKSLMAEAEKHAAKGEDFEKEVEIYDKDHNKVNLSLSFAYVRNKTSNIDYVLVAKPI